MQRFKNLPAVQQHLIIRSICAPILIAFGFGWMIGVPSLAQETARFVFFAEVAGAMSAIYGLWLVYTVWHWRRNETDGWGERAMPLAGVVILPTSLVLMGPTDTWPLGWALLTGLVVGGGYAAFWEFLIMRRLVQRDTADGLAAE